MMRSSFLSLVLTAAVAAPCLAQAPRPIEFGIDGGLAFTLDDPKVTTVQLPVSQFRVGFFLSEQISLEPVVSFDYVNIDDFGSGSNLAADLGLLFHFAEDRTRPQGYLRPFVGLNRASSEADDLFGDESESSTQLNAGLGIGVKLPMRDRLAVRLEGTYARLFEDDPIPAQSVLAVTVGLSFFTR